MSKFIKMTKEGETIEVHPSVVEDHKRLGWKVVEPEPVQDEPAAQPVPEPVQDEPVAQPVAKGKTAK